MRGSLRETKPGTWELRVPLPRDSVTGRRRQRSVSFAGTKRQADRELARLVSLTDAGDRSGAKVRLDVLLEKWWEQKAPKISPTTAREYRRTINRRIAPDIGWKTLDSLGAADLDEYYLRLTEEENLAPATIRQLHAIISGALSQAVKWRWIPHNPARDATLPKAQPSRIEPPSPEKVRELLALAEAESVEMGMFIRLAALLGARRSEVCGLRWDDIDPARSVIVIKRGVVDVAGHLVVKDTKTHSERAISLDDGTLQLLADYRKTVNDRAANCGVELAPDAYIVSEAADGSAPMRPEKATNAVRRLRHEVGLGTTRLHDLRHYVATQLIGAGYDPVTVAQRLGHAQVSTTMNIYAKFLRPKDQAAANDLAALLRGPE